VVVFVSVTAAAMHGGASEDFSDGHYRHWNRRPASVLDLSSSS